MYLFSMYGVIATLATVGYGDIVPVTNLEKFFILLVMIFGAGVYSYAVSTLGSIMGDKDAV